MTGNEARERERDFGREGESNTVEGENGVGHLRRQSGLI